MDDTADYDYDVIIAGASFAGLAAASQFRGRVLLVDPQPIGSRQTSACGTPLSVPRTLGVEDSVLQIYRTGAIHMPRRTAVYPLRHPFCALDYGRFCRTLAQRSEGAVLQARVLGLTGQRVVTTRGTFSARCLVDASGWRAVLGNGVDPTLVDRRHLGFGYETAPPYRQNDGIYFWWDPGLQRRGVAWLFPSGARSRLGVASYEGQSALGPSLSRFVGRFGVQREGGHGGFFPLRLRRATAGPVFLVGDAAGQCLPFTAEGIRPALYFGQRCGQIVQQVIDGRWTLDQALACYEREVERFRWVYTFLEAVQWLFTHGNEAIIAGVLRWLERPAVREWSLDHYERLFALEPPTAIDLPQSCRSGPVHQPRRPRPPDARDGRRHWLPRPGMPVVTDS